MPDQDGRYTLAELEAMPTIATGQAYDLKVETSSERVWLSRVGVDDGMEYDNQVTEEVKGPDGIWTVYATYEAQ